jgi:putrescine aminotransferase
MTVQMKRNSTAEWQAQDRQHLHPFTDHNELGKLGARVIAKAEGTYLFDSDGNKMLDAFAGLWCVNIGYGRDEIADAVARADEGTALLQHLLRHHDAAGRELSEKITGDMTNEASSTRSSSAGSGSEANDTWFRMARVYWNLKGQPKKKTGHQPHQRLSRLDHGWRQPRRHEIHA